MEKGPAVKKSRFKSNVADSHAQTMAAVSRDAPPIPDAVKNFQTYAVSTSDSLQPSLPESRSLPAPLSRPAEIAGDLR
jgi:hypothetical protein